MPHFRRLCIAHKSAPPTSANCVEGLPNRPKGWRHFADLGQQDEAGEAENHKHLPAAFLNFLQHTSIHLLSLVLTLLKNGRECPPPPHSSSAQSSQAHDSTGSLRPPASNNPSTNPSSAIGDSFPPPCRSKACTISKTRPSLTRR
jgi:hypothetical protein